MALIAAAAVPIVVALVLPTFLASGSPDEAQLARAGTTVSSGLAAQLAGTRSSLLLLAANPATVRVAAGSGSGSDARTLLQAVSSLPGSRVSAASIVDVKGVERLRLQNGAIVPPGGTGPGVDSLSGALNAGRGNVYRGQPVPGPDGEPQLTLGTPLVDAAGHRVGAVLFVVPLLPVLEAAEGDLASRGGYSLIVDATSGAVIADTRQVDASPGGDVASSLTRPDQLLTGLVQRAGQAWTTLVNNGWSVGYAPLSGAVPGFGDWGVVVALPAVPAGAPIALLGALALLVLLLISLSGWMARQVLQPAIELDRRREELARALSVARADALQDSLTGLGNHRAFHEEVDRQLQVSRRYGVAVSLVLLDLDDFKAINDTQGHGAGDEVLRGIGGFLASHVRASDRAFRIGGDEFAIVLPHTDAAGGLVLAQRLLAMTLEPVTAARLAGGPTRRPLSFSAGVASSPGTAASRPELYAQADAALLWCKRHGRTSVAAYDPERHILESETVIADLSQAVAAVAAQHLLRPVFQPVIDLRSGRVLGFEGLVRPLSGSGFDNPGALFVAAERSGRTLELDRACLDVIASAAASIAGDRTISLNLSPRSLEAPEFSPTALSRKLVSAGLDPSRVVIEVTERETVDDLPALQASLRGCQRAGMRIAADDVGSGNAGLRLLSQIHFDIVKIDLSLVQQGTQSSMEVLRSLVDLGGRWGAEIIAEGVETPDQLRVLQGLGVPAAQGYLLGRPSDDVTLDQVDLEALLATPAGLPRWTQPVTATPA